MEAALIFPSVSRLSLERAAEAPDAWHLMGTETTLADDALLIDQNHWQVWFLFLQHAFPRDVWQQNSTFPTKAQTKDFGKLLTSSAKAHIEELKSTPNPLVNHALGVNDTCKCSHKQRIERKMLHAQGYTPLGQKFSFLKVPQFHV